MTHATLSPRDHALWRDGRAISLLLAASLMTMANATISPALPGLEAEFAGHPQAALLTRLLISAPSLTVVLCAPFAGLAVDRWGRRRMLIAGVLLFAVTGSAGLVLPTLPAIFASRLALGVAVAMVMTAQTALVGDYYTGDQRTQISGWQVSARNFGGFAFILAAGWLAFYSPRLPFALYLVPGLFALVMWKTIHDVPRTQGEPASGARARAAEGAPLWPVTVLGLAALLMAVTVIFFVMPTQLPFYVQHLGLQAASVTGLALGALTLAGTVAAIAHNPARRIFGYDGTILMGAMAMAAGFVILPAGSLPVIFAGATLVGIGFALITPNFVPLALNATPPDRRGQVAGILTTAMYLGQVISPFLSQAAILRWGFEGALTGAAIVMAAIAQGAGLVILWRSLMR